MIYVCFFNNRKLNLRRIKKTILFLTQLNIKKTPRIRGRFFVCVANYLMIFETTPAPTVRPPSRIAKRKPSSIATGWIKVAFIRMLSPGITISVPSGNSTAPVMSVVRK